MARSTRELLGTVLQVDFGQGRNKYPYLRVRVDMDIRGPLPKETTLVCNGEEKKVDFKFERLFQFCAWCGYLDHTVEDCVDYLEKGASPSDCTYDDSLHSLPPRPNFRQLVQNQGRPSFGSTWLTTTRRIFPPAQSFAHTGLTAPPSFSSSVTRPLPVRSLPLRQAS